MHKGICKRRVRTLDTPVLGHELVERVADGTRQDVPRSEALPRPVHERKRAEHRLRVDEVLLALDEAARRHTNHAETQEGRATTMDGAEAASSRAVCRRAYPLEQVHVLLLSSESHAHGRVAIGDKVDKAVAQVAARRRRSVGVSAGVGNTAETAIRRARGRAAAWPHHTPSNIRRECVFGGGCNCSGTKAAAVATAVTSAERTIDLTYERGALLRLASLVAGDGVFAIAEKELAPRHSTREYVNFNLATVWPMADVVAKGGIGRPYT
eukprot:4594851-Prymnesium_polylepis.2